MSIEFWYSKKWKNRGYKKWTASKFALKNTLRSRIRTDQRRSPNQLTVAALWCIMRFKRFRTFVISKSNYRIIHLRPGVDGRCADNECRTAGVGELMTINSVGSGILFARLMRCQTVAVLFSD